MFNQRQVPVVLLSWEVRLKDVLVEVPVVPDTTLTVG